MKSTEVDPNWHWKPDKDVRDAIARGDHICGASKFGPAPHPADTGLPFPRDADGSQPTDELDMEADMGDDIGE